MKCLRIGEIYHYLDADLSNSEKSRIEKHLETCSVCRTAVEDRRRLQEAASDLPDLTPPAHFVNQIMAAIFPLRVPFHRVLLAAAGGLTAVFVTLLCVFIWSGENLLSFIMNINQSTLDITREFIVTSAKLFKILTIFIRLIFQFSGFLLEKATEMANLAGTELQIGLVAVFLIITAAIIYRMRRRQLVGDRYE